MSGNPGPLPIAIVGMDCRLPGAVDSAAYWRLLEAGESALGELPAERLDRELYYAPERGVIGKTYSTVGGLIPEVPVTAASLRLQGSPFENTDVAFLTIGDVAARALRDARMDPFDLPLRNVGVYIGGTGGSRSGSDKIFAMLMAETAGYLRELESFRMGHSTSLSPKLVDEVIVELIAKVRRKYDYRADAPLPDLCAHVAAHIISHAFGLTGPSLALDSACASSLQALVLGAHAIQQGRIDLAIVGAACLKQYSLVLFSAAQSLTAGDSRPFDADADGLVAAEGYVAMILKRLDRAIADGDSIWGVVRGMGTASDGKGKSLWAPRKEGQKLAIERAYRCGVQVRHLQYLEAHATSTQVGDATEIAALAESLGSQLAPGQRIPLGTSKGNIGHTLETAGIAGLAKVLLALKHATIPPVVGVRTPNPKVDWQQLPFYLPQQATAWPENGGNPRRAAVNSFGIGGLNTHIVIDEYQPASTETVFFQAGIDRTDLTSVPHVVSPPEPIAVIGTGAILPGAFTVAAMAELLNSHGDARCEPPDGRWTESARLAFQQLPGADRALCFGGFLVGYQYDWRRNKIPPKQVAQGNPLQFMLLDATSEALRQAGYDQKPLDRQRTGVVVGTLFRGDFSNQLQMGLRLPEFNAMLIPLLQARGMNETQVETVVQQYREYLLQRMPALLDETGSFTSSTLASRVTKAFDLMGGAMAVDAGPASGLAAVAVAVETLRAGGCDLMICAGAHQVMDLCAFDAIARNGGLAHGRSSRPFSAENTGTVPGEGVGVVLLKRLSDAQRDGDFVRAIIRGVGAATNLRDAEAATEQAVRQALESAGVAPARLAAIQTDGAPSSGEAAELAALARVLSGTPRERPAALHSLAGQIGQCGAAMGTAGVIAATLSLEQGQLPVGVPVPAPAAHVTRHRPLLQLPPAPVPLARVGANSEDLVGVLAGAGSGVSYFAVLERGLGAATAKPDAFQGRTNAQPASSSGARQLPVQRMESSAANDPPPRVVWLFPGQGSQYPRMLQRLAQEHAPAADAIAEADAILRRLGHEPFTELAWGQSEGLGSDIWRTQVSMLIADYAMAASLLALGLRPELVAGHSFGELPALLTAGAYGLEDAIRCTWHRADAQRRCVDRPAGMLAVFAPAHVVEELLAGAQQQVFVANFNGPEQIVVGGDRSGIEHVAALARQLRINTANLPVPCAFHTPLMKRAAEWFADALADIPLRLARIPVVSTATNRAMVDPADFRDSMIASVTAPVRYVDTVNRLDAECPTLFIEVGPQRVLTKLNQKILGCERLHTVPTDDSQYPGIEQLVRIVELLKSRGVVVGTAKPAFETRGESPVVPGRLRHFDATERRRTSRRQTTGKTPGSNGSGSIAVTPLPPADLAGAPAGEVPNPQAAIIQQFLLRFVVEQTGYPEDVVDLDADLEADLGIDSIKKAQMFGEVAEHFAIAAPSGPVSLDDFPTLRHVVDFLATSGTQLVKDQLVSPVTATLPSGQNRAEGDLPTELPRGVTDPATVPLDQPWEHLARVKTSDESARVMSRFVFGAVHAALPADNARLARERRALLLGDNAVADAIAAALQQAGVETLRLKGPADPASAAAEVERLWRAGPAAHLIVATPHDPHRMVFDDPQAWGQRREMGLLVPFTVCQKWFELVTSAAPDLNPRLTAVTAMGGGLGFHTSIESIESGGIAGLVKAVGVEAGGAVRVKVVDFAPEYAPVQLAHDLLAELASSSEEIEVGYDACHRRQVVRGRHEPASRLAHRALPVGSTWLVTGGARGVTAFAARELGRRFSLRLHLIGSSQITTLDPEWRGLPPDQWKNLKAEIARRARERGESPGAAWDHVVRSLELHASLRQFAEAGVSAEYHACDVADRETLAGVLANIRLREGRITGILHGAGIEQAASFAKKRLDSVHKTIAVKVDGAAHLITLLADEPPQYFVGFTSTSGRFGGYGQTDYSLANDLLCKLVRQYADRHPTCRAFCLDWTAWDEIGMAARPESRFALQSRQVKFMPPAEGVDHLIDELQATSADTEIVIVDQGGRTAQHVTMRGGDGALHDAGHPTARDASGTATAPRDASTAEADGDPLKHPRDYGRRHRREILDYLRHVADEMDDSPAESLPLPVGLQRVYQDGSESILREVAAGAEISIASLLAHRPGDQTVDRARPLDVSDFPLVDSVEAHPTGESLVARVTLNPELDVFLRDHQLHKRPFLPAVVSAEILAEAASLLMPDRVFTGFRELDLLRGQSFVSSASVDFEACVRRVDQEVECELRPAGAIGTPDRSPTLARGTAQFARQLPEVPQSTVGEPMYSWSPFSYADRGIAPVIHGPSLRTLSQLSFQHDGGRARLVARLPRELAGERRGERWLIPSAVLDGCLVLCGTYSYIMLEGQIELPQRFDRIRVHGHPADGESCGCRFFFRGSDATGSRYDFCLVGADGRCLVAADAYQTTNVQGKK